MQETIPGKVASPYSGGDAAKKRGGGNATPGTLSRKNYVHRFRKRTLAKSQHLLFVERHRRSQPHPRPHGPEPRAPRLQTPDVSGERDPRLQRLRREAPDGLPLQRAECSWGRRGPCHGARRGGGSAASSPSPRPPPDASHSLPHATSATYNQH